MLGSMKLISYKYNEWSEDKPQRVEMEREERENFTTHQKRNFLLLYFLIRASFNEWSPFIIFLIQFNIYFMQFLK